MQQEVPNRGSWERHPPQARMSIGSRVDQRNDDTSETELVAISWVDRNRCFFITTTCGLGEGEMIQRKRLCQLGKSGRAPPDKVIIEVAQPMAIAKYYKGDGTIDRHNRLRADELRLDRIGIRGSTSVSSASFASTPTFFFNRSSAQTTGRRAASSSLEDSRTSSSTTQRIVA